MPRDSTHGRIADDVAARLQPEAPFLSEHRALVQLGSVFPDIGYYFRKKHDVPSAVRTYSDRIHGSAGEDTYAFLRALAAKSPEDHALQAFVVGVLTHVWADIVFHPLVIYLTGDYNAYTEAKARHHDFETVLELYTDEHWGGDGFPVDRLLREADPELERVLALFFAAWPETTKNPAETVRAYLHGYRYFAWARRQFLSFWTTAIRPVALKIDKPTATLIYTTAHRRRFPELDGPLKYRNPVSGEAASTTLAELRERAVEQCAQFCRDYALPVLRGERSEEDLPVGASLSFGLPATQDAEARYFAEKPWKVT